MDGISSDIYSRIEGTLFCDSGCNMETDDMIQLTKDVFNAIRSPMESLRNSSDNSDEPIIEADGIKFTIVTDKKTGVEYIIMHGENGQNHITPRLDYDGTPYINPEYSVRSKHIKSEFDEKKAIS